MNTAKLITAVETYLAALREIRATGGATNERSLYPPLADLLNAVGAALKPKVFCVSDIADQGAGHPDFGLYTAKPKRGRRSPENSERSASQYRQDSERSVRHSRENGNPSSPHPTAGVHPPGAALPERGVVEVKPLSDDAWLTAESDQVSRYWERYRLVLVTNYRDFVLLGEDAQGQPTPLETFRLADSADDFERRLQQPRAFAREVGAGLAEYLFEIMPAPFVVAHLQVGLTMQALDAPLAEDGDERAGIFLTNALTGWEPKTQKPLPFPELEQERERAERVKQDAPILVVLGNPPYNGYAGMAVDEERELSQAYRTTKRVRRPEGQGLNDLYVRFFRMAERRIAEKTGQGIVCFISNYSWLDGLSFTGMRERYLEAFDTIRIDCLNGDKYKTGKTTPDGAPDLSIFSTPEDPVGIQVGTAITTLVRKADHTPTEHVAFRHLWGQAKRTALLKTAATEPEALYDSVAPLLPLGLPLAPIVVSKDWFDWPALPDLFPASFPGVATSRDPFLVDVDTERLQARIDDYFNSRLSHDEIARRYPAVMRRTARFEARPVRDALVARGRTAKSGFTRYAYRPFDNRCLYWEAETKLLDEKRTDYKPHVFKGNLWLVTPQKQRREWSPPLLASNMGDINHMDGSTSYLPAWLRDTGLGADETGVQRIPNLTPDAQRYLANLNLGVEDLFYHALAVLHDPAYRRENAGALRMEWPRIPLPGWTEFSAPALGRGGSRTAPTVAVAENAPSADQSVMPPQAGIQTPSDTADLAVMPAEAGFQTRTDAADPSVIPVKTRPVPGRGIHPAADAAQTLAASAARGRQLAQLLDSDTPVPGVTTGTLRPEIAAIAVPATTDDRNMTGNDFALTAGWGHYGSGEAVMPGQGKVTERAYTPAEREALQTAALGLVPSLHASEEAAPRAQSDRPEAGDKPPRYAVRPALRHSGASRNPEAPGTLEQARKIEPGHPAAQPTSADLPAQGNTIAVLGDTTFDVYLNDRAYWRNVPANVWRYKLGGYQVLKKWLSYREHSILKRPLKPEEVQHFTDTARRIVAILGLTHSA